ncbi:MAG: hypothetical protein ACFFG0_18385, partial [Candidatus Thorarchaeota archaeon]
MNASLLFIKDPSQNASLFTTSSPLTPEKKQKVTAESDKIDSFDVNPKSGRWTVSDSGATDDLVIDSNLQIITTTNSSSTNSEYLMTRELENLDDNIEYRYKASMDNQSQVEYFRDVLGDSNDCEEGDLEGSWIADISSSIENGVCSFVASSDFQGLRWTDTSTLLFTYETLNKIEFRLKSNISSSNQIIIFFYDVGSNKITKTFSTTTEWQTFTINLADWTVGGNPRGLATRIDFETASAQSTYPVEFYLDYFKIYNDLDYATHIDGEIEDTWDWEDSREYFYDVYGNVTDWNDGSLEGFEVSGGTYTNADSEYGKWILPTGATPHIQTSTVLSIASSTYKWITMEFNSSDLIDSIEVKDAGANRVCFDSTGWNSSGTGQFFLFSCNLGLDADWTSTETHIEIEFQKAIALTPTVFINMIYLYDTELGDIEGMGINTFDYHYVDPNGYYKGSFFTAGQSAESAPYGSSTSIDSSIFDTFIIRVKSEGSNLTFTIRSRDFGTTFSISTVITTSFTTITIDLSSDSDWTGSLDMFDLRFTDDSGNFEGDERIIIDYILLLSSTNQNNQQDFTLGLYDNINSQADLVNVTHHFWNQSYFRWEIELYDSAGSIASYYYSANRSIADVYYLVRLDYNILESVFIVTIRYDNNSLIYKVDWRKDFTTITDRPILFAYDTAPYFFVSTYTVYYGSQMVWLDFINTHYHEKVWRQETAPTSSAWLVDLPLSTSVTNTTNSGNNSLWRINVDRLDAVAGILQMNVTNSLALFDGSDHFGATAYFRIYAVDKSSGALTELIEISNNMDDNQPAVNSYITAQYVDIGQTRITQAGSFLNYAEAASGTNFFPGIGFGIATYDSRSKIHISLIFMSNIKNSSYPYVEYNANITVSDIEDNAGQEFVLETEYVVDDTIDQAFTWLANYQKFQIYQRDLARDVFNVIQVLNLVNAAGEVSGNPINLNPFDLIIGAITLPLNLILDAIFGLAQAIYDLLSPLFD